MGGRGLACVLCGVTACERYLEKDFPRESELVSDFCLESRCVQVSWVPSWEVLVASLFLLPKRASGTQVLDLVYLATLQLMFSRDYHDIHGMEGP